MVGQRTGEFNFDMSVYYAIGGARSLADAVRPPNALN